MFICVCEALPFIWISAFVGCLPLFSHLPILVLKLRWIPELITFLLEVERQYYLVVVVLSSCKHWNDWSCCIAATFLHTRQPLIIHVPVT